MEAYYGPLLQLFSVIKWNECNVISCDFQTFISRIVLITIFKKFNVDTLHLRRIVYCIMFCFDLITSKIDRSAILSQINFNCPSRSLRFNEFLRPVRHVTNYAKSEPINVIMYDFNLVSDLFDFGLDRNQLKQLVKIRLRELL